MTDEIMPNLRQLEAKVRQGHGETQVRPMRSEAEMGILPARKHMRETQTGQCVGLLGPREVDSRVTL